MGERTMTAIVEEGSDGNQPCLVITQLQARAHDTGQVHSTQGVLKTGMVRPGIHEICKTELPYMAKTLEGAGIEEFLKSSFYFDISMDRVLDVFHGTTSGFIQLIGLSICKRYVKFQRFLSLLHDVSRIPFRIWYTLELNFVREYCEDFLSLSVFICLKEEISL
jgi:hypothetical protein